MCEVSMNEYLHKLKSIGFSKNRSTKVIVKPGLVETHHADGRVDATVMAEPVNSVSTVSEVS